MTRERILEIIEASDSSDKAGKTCDYIILIFVVLSVIAIILESYQFLYDNYYYYFKIFEAISISVFSLEYFLRILTADIKYKQLSKVKAIAKYSLTPMALIDLFAILPFYLPMIFPFDMRFLRILRLTKMFRLFKLNRYTNALNVITKVIKNKKEELFSTMFIMMLVIIISASLIYYIETEVQPDLFPDIGAAIWWAVVTLTTVGYGDVYPITNMGKVLAAIISLAGIGIVALPTGIISSGFMEEVNNKKNKKICPHCGSIIDE